MPLGMDTSWTLEAVVGDDHTQLGHRHAKVTDIIRLSKPGGADHTLLSTLAIIVLMIVSSELMHLNPLGAQTECEETPALCTCTLTGCPFSGVIE